MNIFTVPKSQWFFQGFVYLIKLSVFLCVCVFFCSDFKRARASSFVGSKFPSRFQNKLISQGMPRLISDRHIWNVPLFNFRQ